MLATREPGGSPGAEMVRKLLVEGPAERWDGATEALLHFAARRDHLRSTVWPALTRGNWVVSDRFADSTRAYQGHGHGLDLAMLERLYDIAVGDFRPDLTLVLDLPVEAGLARAAARRGGETRYESLPADFHRRVREGFLEDRPARAQALRGDRRHPGYRYYCRRDRPHGERAIGGRTAGDLIRWHEARRAPIRPSSKSSNVRMP